MVDQIVNSRGAHETDQRCDVGESEQILVVAEERLPFLTVSTPARRPQRHQVTGGHRELNRHNIRSHARHRSCS